MIILLTFSSIRLIIDDFIIIILSLIQGYILLLLFLKHLFRFIVLSIFMMKLFIFLIFGCIILMHKIIRLHE